MKHKNILFAAVAVIAVGLITFLNGCTKEDPILPLEPISLIKPDSAIIRKFPGDSMAFEIQFVTDRPLNWVKGMYDIDSTQTTGYVATYPDTLFFVPLDTLDPRVNIYTYKGVYRVPDEGIVKPYDVVRFKVSFEAGKNTFTVGQNYPKGIVSATKEFKIDLR